MNGILSRLSRRHFLGLTSIMGLKSLASGRRSFAGGMRREFRISVISESGNRSAADQLSALFDDLTRGVVLEHRHIQAEYRLGADRSMRLRVQDEASGQMVETPVRRDLSFGTDEAHYLYAEALRLAVRLAPEEVYPVRALGDYYLAFRRFDEGIACFGELISIHPQQAFLSFQLGMIYDRSGRKQAAYAAFRQANRLDPDDDVTMYNLGVTAADLGHHHEAEHWFLEALGRNPDMSAARDRLDQLRSSVK